MPVKPAILSDELLKDLGVETETSQNAMEVDCNGSNGVHDVPEENSYFLEMEKRLCDLVQSGNLHWRHHQMAIGKARVATVTLLINFSHNLFLDMLKISHVQVTY